MHPLEKKIFSFMQRQGLLPPGSTAILAVSGGPDSMAMLHLLAAGRPAIPFTPVAVYVNHGLRPAEADREEGLVRQHCEILGLAAHFEAVPVRKYAKEHGLSLEHAGRILRYEVLEKSAAGHGANRIAVAHTADDQAEEILLRLIRGTGTRGLSGMRLLREGLVIRPLLRTAKKELLDYLADKQIPYCEDSSNSETDFLRNRIRAHLLPLLAEQYNPDVGRTLRRTAAILQAEDDYLAEKTAAVENILSMEGDELRLDCTMFGELHTALQRRLLETAFWQSATPPSFNIIEQARGLAIRGADGTQMHGAKGLRIVKRGGLLCFGFPAGRLGRRGNLAPRATEAGEVVIVAPGTYRLTELGISIHLTEIARPAPEEMKEAKADYLDLDTFSFPLTVRSPQHGDRFHPLGAPGSRKVADFLADRKVPKDERTKVPVLISGGSIIALAGLRIDHAHRITGHTSHCLAVSIEPLSAS